MNNTDAHQVTEQIGNFINSIPSFLSAFFGWLADTTSYVHGFLIDQFGISAFVAGIIIFVFYLIISYPIWKFVLSFFHIAGNYKVVPENQRDPQRLFNSKQCVVMYDNVGHQCEHRYGGVIRCGKKNNGLQADHHIPWSKGGATSNKNFVALCEHHNKSKSNKNPSWGQTVSISFFRRFYMKNYIKPGDKF